MPMIVSTGAQSPNKPIHILQQISKAAAVNDSKAILKYMIHYLRFLGLTPLVKLTKRAHRSRPPRLLQEEHGCLERGACSL